MVIAVYRISHEGWTGEQAKKEAKQYGMKMWQRRMKDYILDYYRDHAPGANRELDIIPAPATVHDKSRRLD